MADLFGRAFRLIVGNGETATEIDARNGTLDGLRIAFAINRDEKRTPNNAEIRIWGLSRAVREALGAAKAVSVSLEAGYIGDVGQIFLGDLRSARTHREGPDLITTISGGDGETLIRTARISQTFPAGTSVGTVLKGLAKALGVSPGNVNAAASQLAGKLGKARALNGLVYDELESFCRTQGLRWSVQDSALQVRAEGSPVLPSVGPLLRNDSGLIGEPEVEKNATLSRLKAGAKEAKAGAKGAIGTVVSGSCLLRPDLLPGTAFRVESSTFQGDLLCVETNHHGDTHAADWTCDFVGKPYGK